MFQPNSRGGRVFKQYLLSGNHFSKVRSQNLAGKYLFRDGIIVKNEMGTILKLNPNDWLTREILLHDGYEKASLNLAIMLLQNGGNFIDVGANFGLYSCTVAANDAVQVYAIEPNYMIIPRLLENVRLNNRNNITILNAALTDQFQFVSFDLPQSNNIGSASFTVKNNTPFSMLSCSLNYIFQSQQMQTAELIKIDIEGNELAVLKDFSFEKYYVKNILLEFDNLAASFDELHDFFLKKGFLIHNITGQLLHDGCSHFPENNLWAVNTK